MLSTPHSPAQARPAAAPTRRLRAAIWFLPLALVLLLAVGWSVFWFYAARRAETEIAAWMKREAEAGRVYACASRTIGGYPFRVEVRCHAPSAELRGSGSSVRVTARDFVSIGQVYAPGLVLAEVTGPIRAMVQGGPGPFTLDFRLLQASLRGSAAAPDRVSVVLEEPKLEGSGGTGDAPAPLGRAKHFELHGRVDPASEAARPAIDFALRADDLVPAVPGLSAQPIAAEGSAVVRGLSDLAPKPLAVRLREWQAAGGRMEILRLRLQRGDALATAAGEVGLTPEGRLNGTVNVTTTGLEAVAELFLGALEARSRAALLAGFQLLGRRAELEGKRAVSLPLRFRDGDVFFGPVPIAKIGPLF